MKTCSNCRMLHEDDYVGSCPMCGANMANVTSGNPDPLQHRWAQQIARTRSEPDIGALRGMMQRNDLSGVVDERLLEVSKTFLIQKESDAS